MCIHFGMKCSFDDQVHVEERVQWRYGSPFVNTTEYVKNTADLEPVV